MRKGVFFIYWVMAETCVEHCGKKGGRHFKEIRCLLLSPRRTVVVGSENHKSEFIYLTSYICLLGKIRLI